MRPALAALALLLATGCSAGTAPEGRQVPRGELAPEQQGPAREGEPVVALEEDGEAYSYELVAQRSSDGLCLELRDDQDGESVACGFEVPERHDLGFFVHQGPGDEPTQDLVVGQVVPEATAVVLEYGSGEPVEVSVMPLTQLDAAVFAAALDPARRLAAVVAVAGDQELERRTAAG